MTKFFNDLGRDQSGSAVTIFALLIGTLSVAYIVGTGTIGTGTAECACFRPDAANLISLNTVERLFGVVMARL